MYKFVQLSKIVSFFVSPYDVLFYCHFCVLYQLWLILLAIVGKPRTTYLQANLKAQYISKHRFTYSLFYFLFYINFHLDKNKTTYFMVKDKAQVYHNDFVLLTIQEKYFENILNYLALYLKTFIVPLSLKLDLSLDLEVTKN